MGEDRCIHDIPVGACGFCRGRPKQYASEADVVWDFQFRNAMALAESRREIAAEDALIRGERAPRTPYERALVRRYARLAALHQDGVA